ncbi:MAG: type I methionyl aminopeptidase [Candidatus Parcubacteria bacterium]|jgi:methionyl aminopeptidase|nr:MAG: type I methionyl aminopeptidase [Candidatus Parcubacteria bacterium]
MVYIKTAAEIEAIRYGSRLLAQILNDLSAAVKPGVSTRVLEDLLVTKIKAVGGWPAFLNYDMGDGVKFPSALCASINDEVVHGPALPGRILKSGDIIDLDIGMEWPVDANMRAEHGFPTNPYSSRGGYFSDTCRTVPVGKISQNAHRLLKVTQRCLEIGIEEAQPGKTLNDIGAAIQKYAEAAGYGVVRDLVGHGVGYFAHEEPNVFNYAIGARSRENLVLAPGMVICIEPMVNEGDWRVKVAANDYTILTADGSLSAHFEHTLVITEDGPEILTLA